MVEKVSLGYFKEIRLAGERYQLVDRCYWQHKTTKVTPAPPIQTPAKVFAHSEQRKEFKIIRAYDCLRPLPPVKWLVQDLIAENTISLVVGEPGSKKTWAMLSLGICLASEIDWAGLATNKARVLYIDEEMGQTRLHHRIGRIMHGYNISHDLPFQFVSGIGFDLTTDNGYQNLVTLVKEAQPEVVFIDALADIIPGADENSVKDIQAVFSKLRALVNDYGLSIIIIHHTNKNGGYRGSSAMKAAVDLLLKVEDKREDCALKLFTEKFRDGEPVKLYARTTFCEDMFRMDAMERIGGDGKLAPVDSLIIDFISRQNRPCSTEEITSEAVQHGVGKEYARGKINKLVKNGYLERTNAGGNGVKAYYTCRKKEG